MTATAEGAALRWVIYYGLVPLVLISFFLTSPEVERCQADPRLMLGPTMGALFLSIVLVFHFAAVIRSREPFFAVSLIALLALLVPAFAAAYMDYGIIDTTNGGAMAASRWDYLYFSVVTQTTLGYGDFQPCPAARLLAAWQAFIAFVSYPFVIAVIVVKAQEIAKKD